MENATLKKIEQAITLEKLAIPVYANHIEKSMFWSGLEKEAQYLIVEKLKILGEESLLHAKMLNEVRRIYLKNSE